MHLIYINLGILPSFSIDSGFLFHGTVNARLTGTVSNRTKDFIQPKIDCEIHRFQTVVLYLR